MHGFTFEVRGKRALSIGSIKESFVTVCTECTGQYANVTKDALKINISGQEPLTAYPQLYDTPPRVYQGYWKFCTSRDDG